jgi:predicted metal-dependent peptidase
MALELMPYFASALMSSTFVERQGLGTVAIDDRLRIYIDPEKIRVWSPAELAGALLHEVNHVIRRHFSRAPDTPGHGRRWNIAGDIEINDDLVAASVTLPPGALLPDSFGFERGLTAEQYFRMLSSEDDAACACGSGADGIRGKYELPADSDVGAPREVIKGIVRTVAGEILRARPGTVPAGLSRWASSLDPVVPWDRVLRAVVRRGLTSGAGGHDYSWSSPSRRTKPPIILPRLRNKRLSVFCVVDTSGSMSQELIDRALSEVCGVAKNMAVENVYLASCDTAATYHGRFNQHHRFELRGGGGTSLEKALDLIREKRLDVELVVFITDGLTRWSDSTPHELRRSAAIVVSPMDGPVGPTWAHHVPIPA